MGEGHLPGGDLERSGRFEPPGTGPQPPGRQPVAHQRECESHIAFAAVGDQAGLSSAIRRLIEELPALDRGALRQAAIDRFGRRAFAQRMRAIYQSAIEA